MESSTLILHRGAREVSLAELQAVPTPDRTATWWPVGHAAVIETVSASLADVGMTIDRAKYGLSPSGGRMFATLDLGLEIMPGVTLTAGVRNSTDQSFPLGFCAGNRVFVCDNLSFSAELMVNRKHTRYGRDRFESDVAETVGKLAGFRDAEVLRIDRMRNEGLTEVRAESLMLRAFEGDLCGSRHLPKVIDAWRNPAYAGDMADKTAWNLYNCFTLVMKDLAASNPQKYAAATMRLQGLLTAAPNN